MTNRRAAGEIIGRPMFSFDSLPDPENLRACAEDHVRETAAWKRQDAGLERDSTGARPIRTVGIIGAGVMGAEIAAAEVERGLPVIIIDVNPASLLTIAARTEAELAASTGKRDSGGLVDRLLSVSDDLHEARKCDLIIESILESLPAKQKLFERLRELLGAGAILASNTSTIPIRKLAESVPSPERFCGLHFFHPVRQRPLAEVIRGPKASDETIAAVVAHATDIDKLPIVVADGPGFLVNRLLLPHLTEALEVLMEGASMEMIEEAALDFGMAKGPFRLMDEIGLDTTLHAGWCMAAEFPERTAISPLLVAMVKSGRLGQKSGAGFFSYDASTSVANSPKPDQAAIEIIRRWAKASGQFSAEEVVLRLVLPMILEASRIIEEDKVQNPRDIDLGAIFGLGFPRQRGGLLWWADTITARRFWKCCGLWNRSDHA